LKDCTIEDEKEDEVSRDSYGDSKYPIRRKGKVGGGTLKAVPLVDEYLRKVWTAESI